MSAKCIMAKVTKILLIVGGLNWGLYGIGMFLGMNLNLVNLIFGSMPVIEYIVYVVVGVCAVVEIFGCPCTSCKDGCTDCKVEATTTENPATPAQ